VTTYGYGSVTINPIDGTATGSGPVKDCYDALVAAPTMATIPAGAGAGVDAKERLADLARSLIPSAITPLGVQKHDTTHSPLGLWQFNHGSYADSSGNGRTLSVSKGAPTWSQLFPGVECLFFNGDPVIGLRLIYNVDDAVLEALNGAITIEALGAFRVYVGATAQRMITFEGSGETEVENFLFSVAFNTAYETEWLHEHGAGINDTYAVPYQPQDLQPCHFAVTKTAGQVVQFYLNGLPLGPPSAALTAPTGGTGNNRLYVGGASTGSWSGYLASLKLIGSALTAAEIKAEYNRTMGPAFGYQP
jgi:hypothetical protein